MNTVFLRNVEVGAGIPKIVVPIVGRTKEEILSQAVQLAGQPIDVVEWRVDFYRDAPDCQQLLETLGDLREKLGGIPVLVTFRTKQEGGAQEISPEQYTALNLVAAKSGKADAVDVEILMGDEVVMPLIQGIHEAGAVVVGSSHEFGYTPSREEMIKRLCKAQTMGCDILKLAVMPKTKQDVMELLSATEEMYYNHARQPLVTMSMGELGKVSRISGETVGSSMTFGSAGQTSAPGQIPLEELREALKVIHRAVEEKRSEEKQI